MIANRTLHSNSLGSASMEAMLFFSRKSGTTAQLVCRYGKFDQGTWAYFVLLSYDSPARFKKFDKAFQNRQIEFSLGYNTREFQKTTSCSEVQ